MSGMGGDEALINSVEVSFKKRSAKARVVVTEKYLTATKACNVCSPALKDVPRIFTSSVLSQISILMQCSSILASFHTCGKAGIVGTVLPPFRMVLRR